MVNCTLTDTPQRARAHAQKSTLDFKAAEIDCREVCNRVVREYYRWAA